MSPTQTMTLHDLGQLVLLLSPGLLLSVLLLSTFAAGG
ncbi:putative membrane protein [Synechococcus sp. A18-25c]|nr:putative membrane protein [Synechococcus sp. A18-25c]